MFQEVAIYQLPCLEKVRVLDVYRHMYANVSHALSLSASNNENWEGPGDEASYIATAQLVASSMILVV